MTPAEIEALLAGGGIGSRDAFKILAAIGRMLASESDSTRAQSLLIRSLEHRDAFEPYGLLLNGLLRETGLYPYAEPDSLTSRDRLAYEFHRADGELGKEDIVFHRVQAEVYRTLLDGENVILSAPTSFGKSLIIDALVASGKLKRIVVVVPTIALIDETRKRLSRFSDRYKIITHQSQAVPDDARGVIYVLTQERVVEREDLVNIDLFVIDEFYKLDPAAGAERAGMLNHAFYKLSGVAKQFYLLGPYIRSISTKLPERLSAKLIISDFETVASTVERVDIGAGREQALVTLTNRVDSSTLIYCQSPSSVRRVAETLVEGRVTPLEPKLREAADWVSSNFHPEWIVARALKRGIGVHHGRMPRSLAQLNVRLFNEGLLKFLVCTSTLIEGVNTAAKHVIIYDNKVAKTKFDYFTFRNIQGRSGRMFRHFVGTVHLFHEPPEPDLLEVDFPAFSQSDTASDALLVQIDNEDLRRDAANRVERIKSQRDLSFETIRANQHIDPNAQIDLARLLKREAHNHYPQISWRGNPTTSQLYHICELLWETLLSPYERGVVRSGRHLAFLLDELRRVGSASAFVRLQAHKEDKRSGDDRVEAALEFLRTWASFHFPRALMALERIQSEVFGRMGLTAGSYSAFAVRMENLLLPAALAALDEYGLPLPVVERMARKLPSDQGLDAVLATIKNADLSTFQLTPFERRLVEELQKSS
jgi:hypothetical protein